MNVQLGQLMDNKIQEDQKTQMPLMKKLEQKQDVGEQAWVLPPPALNTTNGSEQAPLAPAPGHSLPLSP